MNDVLDIPVSSVAFRHVGNDYEIVEVDGKLFVLGAKNVVVIDAQELQASNVTTINILNNANVNISGDANLNVRGAYNVKAGKINMESLGDICLKTNADLVLYANGEGSIRSRDRMAIDGEIIDLNNDASRNFAVDQQKVMIEDGIDI